MSLVITKQNGNYFSLVLDGGEPIISEQNRLTTIGDFCNFKTANGANLILKQGVLFSEITIITGVSIVPTSINNLWNILIDAGFFDGLGISGGGSSVNRFDELLDTFTYFGRDGQLLIVNESDLKLDTIALSIFSEADRFKLDSIESGSKVNVKSNWGEENPESDAFIQNKPPVVFGLTNIFDEKFIYSSGAQNFTIAPNTIIFGVQLNGSPFVDKTNYSVSGGILTYIPALETNDELIIKGLN
jgi:hypothetical protein